MLGIQATELIPDTGFKEPLAILTFSSLGHGKYFWKPLEEPVMCLFALESTIQELR
jgi:hypothetical protein